MRRVLLIVFCVLSGADLTAQSQLPEKALITYEDGSYFIGNILRRDGPVWNFDLSTGDTINLKTDEQIHIRVGDWHQIVFFRIHCVTSANFL